ncbi:MAG: efflux RND transporter periplasmic adaptor subunit [Pseudomonadota bacterium]
MQTVVKAPLWKRTVLGIVRTTVTLAVAATAVGLVVVGRDILAERANAAPTPEPAALVGVATGSIATLDGYEVERLFTGQVQAAQRAELSFELAGTIAEVRFDDGDRVRKGEPLARLDTRLIEAEIARLHASKAASEAQAELARRTTERQSTLQERGFASRQALDAASLGLAELNSRISETEAAILASEIRLEKSTLRAPFDGEIAMRTADVGNIAGPSQPILVVVETAPPQFRVGVPDALVPSLSSEPNVALQINGKRYAAELASILPELDPVTRTRVLLFDIADQMLPPFGETGRLLVKQKVGSLGAWVPLSALEAGPRGLWRILTISETENAFLVGTETVEILFSDAQRAFVRGTFQDGMRFVEDGAHRVVPGQHVRLVEELG